MQQEQEFEIEIFNKNGTSSTQKFKSNNPFIVIQYLKKSKNILSIKIKECN